jgi:hypothetical protein
MGEFACCYVCYRDDMLVKCHQCVYSICEVCILHEKFSIVIPTLCRHESCQYVYLDDTEKKAQHCFACVKKKVIVEFKCGTCLIPTRVEMDDMREGIKVISSRSGIFKRVPPVFNHTLVYYTIKDNDTGDIDLGMFWDVPKPPCNETSGKHDMT